MSQSISQGATSSMAKEEGRASLRDIREDVTQLKDDVVSYGRDQATQAVDAVKEKGRQAMDIAKEAQGKLRECIAEHPTASVLIAVGVGAILGRLLMR